MTETSEQTKPAQTYRVIRLRAENVKRLEAIDITPQDDLVIVAGKNGQGKTSVLDSIMWALAGKSAVPAEPLRKGAHRAKVTLDCGDFLAIREITHKTQKLTLKRKDGTPISPPQEFLDRLLGKLCFDPLEFAGMKAPQRLETLLSLTDGLEAKLGEIADRRIKLYNERTEINVTVRNLKGQLADMDAPSDDWPEKTIDLDPFFAEKKKLQGVIDGNKLARRDLADAREEIVDYEAEVEKAEKNLFQAQKALAEAKNHLQISQDAVADMEPDVAALSDPDLDAVDQDIKTAIDDNNLVEKRQRYDMAVAKLDAQKEKAGALTDALDVCNAEKEQLLASAKLPIDGLGFAQGDVLYQDTLFDQLADSEKLRVSLAMAMAMNPSMRVIRITNGSLLDDDNLEFVRQMAAENGYQVWIECVGEREGATVIIENGRVKSEADHAD